MDNEDENNGFISVHHEQELNDALQQQETQHQQALQQQEVQHQQALQRQEAQHQQALQQQQEQQEAQHQQALQQQEVQHQQALQQQEAQHQQALQQQEAQHQQALQQQQEQQEVQHQQVLQQQVAQHQQVLQQQEVQHQQALQQQEAQHQQALQQREVLRQQQLVDLLNIGNQHRKQNRFADALQCFQEALAIEPNRTDILHQKADMLYLSGLSAVDAIATYNQCIARVQSGSADSDREKAGLLINRAHAYYKLGNYQAAWEDLSNAKILWPEQGHYKNLMDDCRMRARNR